MALPIAAAAIAGGAALAGSAVNALTGANANKKNREFQEKMYQTQKADNLDFWKMQNDYNSPQEQMKRLQASGLNPNLIYGSGAVANNASAPTSPDRMSYDHQPAKIDLGHAAATGLNAYFDTEMKLAQLDNLKAQNTVILEEGLLKKTQRENMSFDLGLKGDLRDYSLEYGQQRAYKMAAEHVIKENEAEIILQTKPSTIEKAALEVLKIRLENAKTDLDIDRIREDIRRIKANTQLQELDIDLKRNGINPTDPIYFRILGRILETQGISIK